MHNSKVCTRTIIFILPCMILHNIPVQYRTLGPVLVRANRITEISKKYTSTASGKNGLVRVPRNFFAYLCPHPSSAAWLQPVSGSASTQQPNSSPHPSPPANLTKLSQNLPVANHQTRPTSSLSFAPILRSSTIFAPCILSRNPISSHQSITTTTTFYTNTL